MPDKDRYEKDFEYDDFDPLPWILIASAMFVLVLLII